MMAKAEITEPEVDGANGKPSEPKPTRVLPTNRVAFTKQQDILRAFGALGAGNKAVSNTEVSKLVNLHNATVGLLTPFLADVGLLRRTPEGFTVSEEVVKFNQAFQWSPESAGQRMSPVISRAWFSEPILSRLRFSPLPEDDAIRELAIVASAGPSYKQHLSNLIDYLELAGLITRENEMIRLAQQRTARPDADKDEEQRVSTAVSTEPPPPSRQSPFATGFVNDAAGVVQFNISVKVDMTEFGAWEATRISAFFAGIAQVLAAKANMERQVTGH